MDKVAEHTSIDALDDQTLLARIRNRDESALATLYTRYARLLYSIALRITRDRHVAEEVLQDVFSAVWQRGATFRPTVGPVANWLSGIARNRALDVVRSRWHRTRAHALSLEQIPEWASAVEQGLEQLAVIRVDLRNALAVLPVRQRQAIVLAYVVGLSCSEIAQQLDEPLGTVKGRLRLGLAKLRTALPPGH